jgi:hypothetical protein
MKGFFLSIALASALLSSACSDTPEEGPQIGARYTVHGTLNATGIFSATSNRELSHVVLIPILTSGSEVAFRHVVPIGTNLIIVEELPKRLGIPFFPRRYKVRLEPTDLPNNVDTILELGRGNEGALDGLNPNLYKRK